MEGALKWREGKSGQRYFHQREGRAGVVVVSLTRRAKRAGSRGNLLVCFSDSEMALTNGALTQPTLYFVAVGISFFALTLLAQMS